MAKKVKQEDVIGAQVHSLFQAGILDQDENGNLIVTGGISLNEFQDCDKDDSEMPEYDARRKQTRKYNNFGSNDPPNYEE